MSGKVLQGTLTYCCPWELCWANKESLEFSTAVFDRKHQILCHGWKIEFEGLTKLRFGVKTAWHLIKSKKTISYTNEILCLPKVQHVKKSIKSCLSKWIGIPIRTLKQKLYNVPQGNHPIVGVIAIFILLFNLSFSACFFLRSSVKVKWAFPKFVESTPCRMRKSLLLISCLRSWYLRSCKATYHFILSRFSTSVLFFKFS